MFTIEVKKRGKDEEFSFKDLEMFHQECASGKIEKDPHHRVSRYYDAVVGDIQEGFASIPMKSRRNFWVLICNRCNASVEIEVAPKSETAGVIATAIDGQERKITEEVRVIQKT